MSPVSSLKPKPQAQQDPLEILALTPYRPSPLKARAYNLLRCLADRGHRVTLIASSDFRPHNGASGDLVGLEEVHEFPLSARRVALSCVRGVMTSRRPVQAYYAWNPDAFRHAVHLAGEGRFDLIHVAHLRAGLAGLKLLSHPLVSGRVPVIWDAGDCISDLLQQTARRSALPHWRSIARLEKHRTQRFERELMSAVSQVVVAGERERERMLELFAEPMRSSVGGRISVVPNAVDLARFPARTDDGDGSRPGNEDTEPAVIMTGTMDYHPNVSAAIRLAREIMPAVWKVRPGVRLRLVGAAPHRAVRRLSEESNGRVEVTGWVPQIAEHLHRATVSVAPLTYATGTQFKVLEAMATATVCITSPSVAEALGAESGRHLITAASNDQFARSILKLLEQPERRESIGAAARRFVETGFRWSLAADRLESVYRCSIDEPEFSLC